MEESKLVKRAQKGDRDAMEALIGGYYPLVFAYFYKNTGRYHQSKDLTQEVFIKMISGLSGYRPRAAFKSWLFAIASNHLKNHYRSASRRPEPAEFSEALQEVLPADSREISRAELRQDIRAALEKLPPEQREAVVLRFYHDFTPREIAEITGVKEATIKSRIRYGLDKLKKELEGYGE